MLGSVVQLYSVVRGLCSMSCGACRSSAVASCSSTGFRHAVRKPEKSKSWFHTFQRLSVNKKGGSFTILLVSLSGQPSAGGGQRRQHRYSSLCEYHLCITEYLIMYCVKGSLVMWQSLKPTTVSIGFCCNAMTFSADKYMSSRSREMTCRQKKKKKHILSVNKYIKQFLVWVLVAIYNIISFFLILIHCIWQFIQEIVIEIEFNTVKKPFKPPQRKLLSLSTVWKRNYW